MDKKITNLTAKEKLDRFTRWVKNSKPEAQKQIQTDWGTFWDLSDKPEGEKEFWAPVFASFCGGLTDGMTMADTTEAQAGAKAQGVAEYRTAIKNYIDHIDNERYLLALLKMAEELAKPESPEAPEAAEQGKE